LTNQPPPYGDQPPPYGDQPSYGQQSPHGQPPTGPPQQPPPYGPPPRQRRSGTVLIAVILIVVLALAGGAVGAALMLGGGDDSESSGGGEVIDSGETMKGTGYTYGIPEGWDDATSDVGAMGIDSAVRAEDEDGGFRRNVVVEVQPANGATDPEEIRSQWESNIGEAVGGTPEPIDGISIDGQDALGIRIETTQQDIDIVQVAYLAIYEDQIYSIALSSHRDVEDEATAEFEQVLDTWSWT
jgi:hypothetical protein